MDYGTASTAPFDPASEHLRGNAIQADPFTFTPLSWRYLVDRFGVQIGVQSVLDVGSGCGYAAFSFSRMGVIAIAIDGFTEKVAA